MNVFYTCDNNYVWLMGISAISLFENNRQMEDLNVYLLGDRISDESKNCIQEIADKYGRKIIVIDVPKLDIPEKLTSERWPLSAFTRLYAGELLPDEVTEALYLDCDTIICGKLKQEDFRIDDSHAFYGVKECIGGRYKRNIGLAKDAVYINAGVMYLNLERLRRINVFSRLDEFMKEYSDFINYADQDVLNGTFNDEIGAIPPRYDLMTIEATHSHSDIVKLRRPTNFYSNEELEKVVENPVIIHYTTNMHVVRPWFSNSDHPFKDEFEKYMRISPWENRELSEKRFDGKADRIIKVVDKLPREISLRLLGIIHSFLKPDFIMLSIRLQHCIKRKARE